MKLKYLFLILISLSLSECYFRVCVYKSVVRMGNNDGKVSFKPKSKLKHCGDYPCATVFFDIKNEVTNESALFDIKDCLIDLDDSKCNDEDFHFEGKWGDLTKKFPVDIKHNEGNLNQTFDNFKGKMTVKCCKEDYCNMSLRTRYSIGSIMAIVILGLILIKGLKV
uniref:Uncharacterized protein n=1 Tax=Strongyloides venezuelensis TaxID=75913 RepID=A0A0K0EW73_STRVS